MNLTEIPTIELKRELSRREALKPDPGLAYVARLVRVACKRWNITWESFDMRTRNQRVIHCRWAVWYVLRTKGFSAMRIGRIFRFDHGSILWSWKKAPKLMETDVEFATEVAALAEVKEAA